MQLFCLVFYFPFRFLSSVVFKQFEGPRKLFPLARRSRQSKRLKRRRRYYPCYAQVIVLLITGDSRLGLVTENSVDRAAVIPTFRQLRLNGADNSIATFSWGSVAIVVAIWILGVIVVAVVRIVIVAIRIAVVIRGIGSVGVVRIVIPWVKSPPEATGKNKDVAVIKVGGMPVPITVPIAIVTRKHPVIGDRAPDRRRLRVRGPHVLPC